jgi:hypothetical protein
MKRLFAILLTLALYLSSYCQKPELIAPDTAESDTVVKLLHVLKSATFDGQTYPLVELDEIIVIAEAPRDVRFNYRRHARLVYNVRRVYPYALIVREEFGRINRTLEMLPDERARDNFLRQYEKDIFKTYEGDIRKLTFTQGKILIKLIDRETQATSYELIRDYRGKFAATFWQSIARIFGSDLRATYEPAGDDYLIELIVRDIEAGRL